MDFNRLPTPCYVVDEGLLRRNLELLHSIETRTGCHILLALKAFSMYSTFPLIARYLDGVTASGLLEARLGYEEMGKAVHVFSPAYSEDEFDEIIGYCGHIVFNSFDQWRRFAPKIQASGKQISCGIRINPGYSEIETDLYNPCFQNSRLGVTLERFEPEALDGIEGLHFHTMCEQNADTLERTLAVVEEKFGRWLGRMKWINFGGGHHITRPDYDVERLVRCIEHIQDTYDVEVYLEPGEAVALNTGFLVAKVLDVVENGMNIAILDTSAACHMPDVLEMPYRPQIIGAGIPREKAYTYRLGGPTCLAGDIIGDYSFDQPLFPGKRLVFCDMAIYTMVKNNTFNGMNLPSIVLHHEDGTDEVVKRFGYEDFKARL
nr:carboxynorspermidine decarboxylase [Candidatus Soleaferrea massiliensis]